jgi:hypothetical protein
MGLHGLLLFNSAWIKLSPSHVTAISLVSRRNSGVLVINIYSFLWHNSFLLIKTIRKSLQVLLSFISIECEDHCRPYRHHNEIPLHPTIREWTSTSTAAVAVAIPRRKSLFTLTNLQKKEPMIVKPELRGGQLFIPPQSIHRPGNRSSKQCMQWHQNWLLHHLTGKWGRELQLPSVQTQSS